ncbi:T9SS type A sorting domain-containing protein [Flavobacterium sp. 28YEA47A]|uniref:T9SS type A sorting domain-containing protein n=1 Tax=Flavobacterium sp. 28YEA47A TaxID=3156276 RepID=UPI003515CFD8
MAGTFSYGQAFTATYDFAGITANATNGITDPTPVPTAAGLTFGSFHVVNPNLGPSVTGSSGAGRFSYPNQPEGATNGNDTYSSLTGAIDPGVYYEVVLTPAAGQTLSLSSVTFRSQRSGTGVRTYAVRSSVDNYGANLPASIATNANVNVQTGNVFFWILDSYTAGVNGNTITLGSTYSNLTTPVTFRFYGFNAEGAGGNFSIDDVAFTGTTASLGVKENAIAGLKVYPNPVTNGKLFITSDANVEKTVAIYDVLGKQVANTTATDFVNVSNLKGGVYIVKITEEGKTATRKLVIK